MSELKNSIYSLDCGSGQVRYRLKYSGTKLYFDDYLSEAPGEAFDIAVSDEYMQENAWLSAEGSSAEYLEYQCLMLATGNYLLPLRKALFHGAAFLWRERAWILTGPSGVGKSTMLKNWHIAADKQIRVINGDKPVLDCDGDGRVEVYPSPWRGKENYGTKGLHAPLGGIIILKQADADRIERCAPEDCVRDLFREFISYPETEEQLRAQADILGCMLRAVPVWRFENRGDIPAAQLAIRTAGGDRNG